MTFILNRWFDQVLTRVKKGLFACATKVHWSTLEYIGVHTSNLLCTPKLRSALQHVGVHYPIVECTPKFWSALLSSRSTLECTRYMAHVYTLRPTECRVVAASRGQGHCLVGRCQAGRSPLRWASFPAVASALSFS